MVLVIFFEAFGAAVRCHRRRQPQRGGPHLQARCSLLTFTQKSEVPMMLTPYGVNIMYICTSPWATYPPPPPPNGMVPPFPRIIRILGMMLAMLGMLSSTVRVPDPLSPREPTPPHLSQHPTLNQTTLQPLLNPNPKPKSTQNPNPPETHRKPTLNQP